MRRRQWTNIDSTLGQSFVFSGLVDSACIVFAVYPGLLQC